MKLKKTFTSKPFLAGSLAVLCVGILAGCLFWQNSRKPEFTPAPVAAETPAKSWAERPTAEAAAESRTEPASAEALAESPSAHETAAEEYPKEVESNEEQTVIHFTEPEPAKPTAPPAPEGKEVREDPGPEHPVTPAPETAAAESPDSQTPDSNPVPGSNPVPDGEPVPGSTNEKGEVYDPLFGWVMPGKATQIPITSDGDPNKMVGNMGN